MFLQKSRRKIAFALLSLTVLHTFELPVAYALTSGPSQPEVQSFEPAGTTEMVDLFSGDFTYNIPLFELPGPNGGYPFNLAYHAGIGIEQEASWVGLGWSLNPGAINRQMRGLPDDFNGDVVRTKMSVEPSVTAGVGAGAGVELFGGDPIKAAIGFSVYNNNYRGVGYSIDGSLGFSVAAGARKTAGLGLGFSLDSQEGVTLSPSLGLDTRTGMANDRLGVSYNSRQGLKSLTYSASEGSGEYSNLLEVSGSSYTLSLFNPGFTPQVGMPYNNVNLSGEVKVGGSWWGVFGSPYVRGFYNEQRFKNDKKWVGTKAYGYLNYQHATEPEALLDFSREQDGMVRKESPNLPVPSLTYDIYSLTGQGMAAMYRPMRADHGAVHDPTVETNTIGGSIGGDVGPALSHVGGNLSVNHGRSTSGPWTENNSVRNNLQFQHRAVDDPYEPWYFKVHGESSAQPAKPVEDIGGDLPVRVQLGGGANAEAKAALENPRTGALNAPDLRTDNRERSPRGEVIMPFTNAQLLKGDALQKGDEELNNLFKISYLTAGGATQKYNRQASERLKHTAGFTALNTAGLRYTYALPAYNTRQEEVQHSAVRPANNAGVTDTGAGADGDPAYEYPGTDKYLSRTEMPAFPHAYLLTSIVGPDYVDVTGDGVTADDLGYWVKFTYQQVASAADPFKWRAPFAKSLYNEGLLTDKRDDRGSYAYGEKEVWYLAQAETKSHLAKFETGTRADGWGVADPLQDVDSKEKGLRRLEKVTLFTRSAGESRPLKVVRFDYDPSYPLCKNVPNSEPGKGKLTLHKVWFEYGTSRRGQLNPYTFTYHPRNPGYDANALDRWGTYKPYPAGNPLFNREFPYAEQDPTRKADIDGNAAAWSLTEIKLPSGGKIKVDYESDDYAYVQHRPAMQMTPLVNPFGDPAQAVFNLSTTDFKVRFHLERPVAASSIQKQGDKAAVVKKYLDTDRGQVFFKLKIALRAPGESNPQGGNYQEYISGYANINWNEETMGLEKGSKDDEYAYGYFELIPEKIKGGTEVHPFSLRAWQHLRTNQPELLSFGKSISALSDKEARLNTIKSIVTIIPAVRDVFKDFNKKCLERHWGREIVATHSWIRLNSPDGVKYGGGLRVKQITLSDEWKEDAEGVYGQTYDYTIEENDRTISSGVATYEPFAGGEENALRYAKKFTQSVPLASNNSLFFELPVNEGYFPGAGVGYRKVTVKSLASAALAGDAVNHATFPKGTGVTFGTSGVTVHEFYTAKDFPVTVDETEKVNRPSNVFIPVPLLGTLVTNKLTASQGYSITTNDMHGKPLKTTYYRQAPDGKTEPDPISWVRYNYRHEKRVYEGKNVLSLLNTFKEEDAHTISVATGSELGGQAVKRYTLGQETEFFLDMREHEDNSWVGGVQLNVEFLYIPIVFAIVPMPFPVPWPNVSKNSSRLRTVVTNKVMFKSGVLESVEAYDGGSLVKTQHLKWDKLTGKPVLTTVTNNFDAAVYTYAMPAYQQYAGMGPAYRNTGLEYNLSGVQASPSTDRLYYFSAAAAVEPLLYPGDELIIMEKVVQPTDERRVITKAVYMGTEDGQHTLQAWDPLPGKEYTAYIMRSGYRNQLTVDAGSITALKDPTRSRPGPPRSIEVKVPVPPK